MTAVNSAESQQAVVEAALVLLERMGLSPADPTAVPQVRKPVPTSRHRQLISWDAVLDLHRLS